ncbi:low-density lipoprotein receptor class A domain-containing protein 4 isoform X1 [Arapaima gigas]
MTQHWWRSSMQEAVFVDKNISAVSSTECKFHCTNGSCLRLDSLICNGLNDCGDNSDEGNCPALTQQPPPAVFTCMCPTSVK